MYHTLHVALMSELIHDLKELAQAHIVVLKHKVTPTHLLLPPMNGDMMAFDKNNYIVQGGLQASD